ncbi:MAG: RidA family protein [Acidimicrobiales bacterium]
MTRERTVLLEDPARPGAAAVIKSGPFLFLSSVDGDTDPKTGHKDISSFGDGPAQARNAYQTVVDRLVECGYDGSAAVRIEHATSSQEWRLARMALWPEYFGEPTQAVSQGYQGKMAGQNMITVTTVATTGEVEREIITPGPNPGRASRISRCGPFLFIIGVRGQTDLATGEDSPEESPEAFAAQVRTAYRNIDHHLGSAGADKHHLVRFDGFIRDINRAMEHRDLRTEHFDGRMDVASTVVACPLGGRSDIELSAMAVRPGEERDVTFYEGRTDLARTVRAGGFIFASGALGNRGVDGKLRDDVCGKLEPQLDLALERIAASLDDYSAPLESVVRLDVYVKDQHRYDDVHRWLHDRFNGDVPTVAMHGIELESTAEAELTAIAADDRAAT